MPQLVKDRANAMGVSLANQRWQQLKGVHRARFCPSHAPVCSQASALNTKGIPFIAQHLPSSPVVVKPLSATIACSTVLAAAVDIGLQAAARRTAQHSSQTGKWSHLWNDGRLETKGWTEQVGGTGHC